MLLGNRCVVSGALPLKNSRESLIAFRSAGDRPPTRSLVQHSGIRCEGNTSNLSMAARLVSQPTDGPKFASPIRSYDVHIYFWQTDEANTALAKALRQECMEKFKDLNIYKFWDRPIGPHPTGMFEIDLKSLDQFSRFVPWIQVNRRGLSVLVHPNTGRPLDDHTVNAIWIGEKVSLNTTHLSNDDDEYGLASHGLAPSVTAQ